MFLFFIVIDPYQKQISAIILESLHIILLPDLINRSLCFLISLQ